VPFRPDVFFFGNCGNYNKANRESKDYLKKILVEKTKKRTDGRKLFFVAWGAAFYFTKERPEPIIHTHDDA
jgi:hypothetical protein